MKRRWILAAAACAALGTSGCALGPDFTRPAAPESGYAHAPPAPSAARNLEYGADVADGWYQLFHSTALDQLVRAALAGNPDLEAARHGLAAAQYELRAVSGAALPQFDASGQIGRAHINGSVLYSPVNAFTATGNRYALGVALAYNVDIFGGTRRAIESQRATTAAVRDQVLNTYVTLVDQTVITAFDYAATLEQIEVTRTLVEQLQAQFELTRTLENAGKVIRSDTLQTQTQLENLRATLPSLEQQRDIYRNALAKLCGAWPDRFTAPALTMRDFALPTTLPLSLPSALVRQRPDVLAAEDNLHQASAAIGVAEAARFPSFSIFAQYAQQTTLTDEFFTKPGGIWSGGLNATAPIFHGGALAARQHEAEERYRQALASYRSTVVGAFVEVADSLASLEHDSASYRAHTEALTAARENRDLALEQYRAGKYNELQVLTTEQQYEQAALAEVQADVQRFTDIATLFRALGGGWWNAPHDPTALASATATPAAKSATERGSQGEN
ncbi:MAG TPA: efflux transporter outer membrane subunit [Steroidobacteraceae bacterium]|nr:efflux transporter outer membrane subunit [Steroidobacteraceae bacterium]